MLDLYESILRDTLAGERMHNDALVELRCFQTIVAIREVLDNAELSDFECIEKIVVLMERLGIDGGTRHDFG